MRRVVDTIEQYQQQVQSGKFSKHDEVFIKEGALGCEGVIVGTITEKNSVKNGDNDKAVTIRTNETITIGANDTILITGPEIELRSANALLETPSGITARSIVGDIEIQSVKGNLENKAQTINNTCTDFRINGKPVKANEFYSEYVKSEGEDGEIKMIGVSEFSAKHAMLSNVIKFIPIDTQYLSDNNIAFVKFVCAVTNLGLKEAKEIADIIKGGSEKDFEYATVAEASQAILYAQDYAVNTFDWRPGVRLVQLGDESDLDDYLLLYKGNEVATIQNLTEELAKRDAIIEKLKNAFLTLNINIDEEELDS